MRAVGAEQRAVARKEATKRRRERVEKRKNGSTDTRKKNAISLPSRGYARSMCGCCRSSNRQWTTHSRPKPSCDHKSKRVRVNELDLLYHKPQRFPVKAEPMNRPRREVTKGNGPLRTTIDLAARKPLRRFRMCASKYSTPHVCVWAHVCWRRLGALLSATERIRIVKVAMLQELPRAFAATMCTTLATLPPFSAASERE